MEIAWNITLQSPDLFYISLLSLYLDGQQKYNACQHKIEDQAVLIAQVQRFPSIPSSPTYSFWAFKRSKAFYGSMWHVWGIIKNLDTKSDFWVQKSKRQKDKKVWKI